MWLTVLLAVLSFLFNRFLDDWQKKDPETPLVAKRKEWLGGRSGQAFAVASTMFDIAVEETAKRPVGSKLDTKWLTKVVKQRTLAEHH